MIKIGITYLYTIMRYGYPPKLDDDMKALSEISRMGFHFLEMEALGKEHGAELLRKKELFKAALLDNGIHIHNFCIVNPDLVSLNDSKRKTAYDDFKRMAELGIYFGAETLHLASYAPPVKYNGSEPYKLNSSTYSFGDEFSLTIPDGFSWPRVWNTLVESCRFCAEAAKEYNVTVIMEPRVGEIICSVDSMIRLIQDVDMTNFKANFDVAHFSAQRENVVLALMKLENMFANIHLADNIPSNVSHIPLGDGSVEWSEFFRVLSNMNYDGYMGLDFGRSDTIDRDLIRSRDYILNTAGKAGCKITF